MASPRWWHGATLYHVYVRSFTDLNGDGFGDLPGLTSRLDYLHWLGVDGIWCSPTMPSPDHDWGYDVSDYLGVHPELGTMEDLDRLVGAARAREMAVLLDLVPNHTSAAHPWFVEARQGRDARFRDYYVWADPAPGGGVPNNWLDATGESAWSFDPVSGQYYLHNFLEQQPDLNWWNPEVHAAFEDILRFWFGRGVAGFRIDVAHGLYKDADLRDNPKLESAGDDEGRFGYEPRYSMNRPETHDVYRHWRKLAQEHEPERLLLGETWVFPPSRLAEYYGEDDQLHLGFNFPFALSPFAPRSLAGVVRETLGALGEACPVWTASNHDIGRFASRWAEGDERRARLALTLLATLPGTVVLYYGDELAMTDVAVPRELQRDPMSWGNRGGRPIRDRARTPMAWSRDAGGGFCSPEVTPWLPMELPASGSVEEQRSDERSVLYLVRALIELRRRYLRGIARYEELLVDDARWVYRSGPLTIAANFSENACRVALDSASVVLSSTLERSAEVVQGSVALAPYEGVVLIGG